MNTIIMNFLSKYHLADLYLYGIVLSIKLCFVILATIVTHIIMKQIIVRIVTQIIKKIKWNELLIKKKILNLLSQIILVYILYNSFLEIFQDGVYLITTRKILVIYSIIIISIITNRIVEIIETMYYQTPMGKEYPIEGYIQALKVTLQVLYGICIIGILINRPPFGMMSLLGGLTAIILLIFKDTILGFVSGIQVTANKMIKVGDWIEMPEYGADGDVIAITITTVKVQNWDKTITTVPTYSLISKSFKNWKGMTKSGGRRIKRAINIDITSIKFCDEHMLKKFKKIRLLQEYIAKKEIELKVYNEKNKVNNDVLINERRMTNIGTFRAYIISYLRNHPKIHQDLTFLIRQLNPTAQGLPLEIYVFTNDTVWENYEEIQSNIFDHILAVIVEFELSIYQNPMWNNRIN